MLSCRSTDNINMLMCVHIKLTLPEGNEEQQLLRCFYSTELPELQLCSMALLHIAVKY